MTKLTQATAVAIATAASQVRGDWDHPGILAALRVEADKGTTAEDVFVAIANLCDNREARTPGLLNKPGTWWQKPAGRIARRGDHNVRCAEHDQYDMPCPHLDHHGQMTLDEIADAKAAVLAELAAARNTTTTRREPAPLTEPAHRLEQVRALIPQEEA